MVYTFIPISYSINELSNYYKSNINYSEIFDALDSSTKNDLEFLTNVLYENNVKNIDGTRQTAFFLDGIQKIDFRECTFQIYVNEKQLDFKTGKFSPKIGVLISMVNNDYLGNTPDLLQNIYISNFDIVDESNYKNVIYNILFMCHIIITNFKYSPLFYNVYHGNDLKQMIEIRKKNIKLFGNYTECSVCYEQTITYTDCKHYLCQKCYTSLDAKICPMCRECISINDLNDQEYQ